MYNDTDIVMMKRAFAKEILQKCVGTRGIWADPTRYAQQCWTRDFGLAIRPAIEAVGLELTYAPVIELHLREMAERQQPNGQIPILYLDDEEAWLRQKLLDEASRDRPSFMLSRYRAGELERLTPGTRDSEIFYLLAVIEHCHSARSGADLLEFHHPHMSRAARYIDTHLLSSDGLLIGCDWRDTMEKELGGATLLSNNCVLYRVMCEIATMRPRALALRQQILSTFWDGERLIDYPGNPRVDPLGTALAVLYNVVTRDVHPNLLEAFASVDTPHGVSIRCKHNPLDDDEAAMIERTQGVVVWPFIVGFTVLALVKMAEEARPAERGPFAQAAEAQFEKLVRQEGFREYYDPATGKGYGAQLQLWSAALFLRAESAMKHLRGMP